MDEWPAVLNGGNDEVPTPGHEQNWRLDPLVRLAFQSMGGTRRDQVRGQRRGARIRPFVLGRAKAAAER
jgi:hypothetical protein